MQFYITLFLIQCIIIYHEQNLLDAKALVGTKIKRTNHNSYPSAVAVLYYAGNNSQTEDNVICTAVMISLDHILTAEHCLYMYTDQYIMFVVASNDVREGLQRFPMWWISYDQWKHHHNITSNLAKNDIAIVKVTRRMLYHLVPAIISHKTSDELVGWRITIVGWGINNEGVHPRKLKQAKVKVITRADCSARGSELQGEHFTIFHNWFCSKAEPYIISDRGDSGGPVYDRNGTLVGITVGNCPNLNGQFHPEKSNLHISVGYYHTYFTSVLQL